MPDTIAIRTIHQISCPAHTRSSGTGGCNCTPSYMPEPWDAATGKKVRGRACATLREARNERNTMRASLKANADARVRGGDSKAWSRLATEVADGIEDEKIKNREGATYKPSAARAIVRLLRSRLVREDCPLVGKAMAQITAPVIRELIAWLAKEDLKPNSIRRHLDAVGVVWRYAETTYALAAANPISKVTKPKGEERREPVMASDAASLIDALPIDRGMRALWATAAYTGMRRGEILGLEWGRVDLDRREIRVEVSWNEATSTKGSPKTPASRRVIPISAPLADHLRAWKDASGTDTGYVFAGRGDRPLDFAAATRRAHTQWKHRGLAPVSLHQLRHGCATTMAAAGVDIRTVQAILGHADITTTARYVHERPEANVAALDRVADAIATA